MIYLLDSTKVPFKLSHSYHAHVLLFLPYTVLSQAVLLGLRFIHNSGFFPPTHPLFWLEPLCSSSSIITYVHYIFSTTRISSRSLFYSSTSISVWICKNMATEIALIYPLTEPCSGACFFFFPIVNFCLFNRIPDRPQYIDFDEFLAGY